jgi:hypothetical protein
VTDPERALTFSQEFILNQPSRTIRSGGRAAASFVTAAIFFTGCGGPEGAGTVNMTAAKEIAAQRGIADGGKRAPVAGKASDPRRGRTPVKPQRQGH